MTTVNNGFSYFYAESTATLAVTSTSSNVNAGIYGDVFVIQNDGPYTAYVAFGPDSTVTAVAGGTATLAAGTASFPILSGSVMTLRAVPGNNFVAGISDASATTLRISRGSGV